jgi:MFS family permease
MQTGWAITYQACSLNVMMIEVHGLDDKTSTLVYVIASAGFLIATPLAGLVLENQILSRRGLLYMGYIVMGTGMIIRTGDFGSVPILWLSIVGQVLSGAATAIILCVAMPELMDSIESQPELYAQLEKDFLIVYVSSIQVLFGCVGQSAGMFLSAMISQALGYNWTYIGGGIYVYILAAIYYISCGTKNPPPKGQNADDDGEPNDFVAMIAPRSSIKM